MTFQTIFEGIVPSYTSLTCTVRLATSVLSKALPRRMPKIFFRIDVVVLFLSESLAFETKLNKVDGPEHEPQRLRQTIPRVFQDEQMISLWAPVGSSPLPLVESENHLFIFRFIRVFGHCFSASFPRQLAPTYLQKKMSGFGGRGGGGGFGGQQRRNDDYDEGSEDMFVPADDCGRIIGTLK